MPTDATPPTKEQIAAWARDSRRRNARLAALDLAPVARIKAEAEFRRNSANAVVEGLPRDIDHLVGVLWPAVSLYAESVFDAIAEARLRALGAKFLTRRYLHWLECTCIPAILEDFAGVKLWDHAKHIHDVIGETQWPAGVDSTRRALGRLMTEFLGGTYAERVEKRIRVVLTARIGLWEAAAIEKQMAAKPRPSGESIDELADWAGRPEVPKLDVVRIENFINDEGYDNKTLATALKISLRAVSSLRNGGKSHGVKALTKLANLMKCDVEDLYLS
jgi:DNA-binding Xre family transcriptional regulator